MNTLESVDIKAFEPIGGVPSRLGNVIARSKATKQSIKSIAVVAAAAGIITLGAPAFAGVEAPDIKTAVNNAVYTTYTLNEDESLSADIGDMVGSTKTITSTEGDIWTVNGNNYAGITVGSGQTLNISNVNFSGFKTNDLGSVIYSDGGTIGTITADFSGNTANSSGGAIYNCGDITSISGSFTNNQATNDEGGAIYNEVGTIGTITGNFTGNTSKYNGGAIYNYDDITSITGTFTNNQSTNGYGGAIYNSGTITSITGDFIGNTAYSTGGAISNYGTITSITGNFIENTANATGGAIFNQAIIGTINGDFIGNQSKPGAAIRNSGTITSITGDFIGNKANAGAAIRNFGTITSITGNFIGNIGSANGGAINNGGTITNGITNSSFINNTATTGKGGAILTNKDLTFVSDNGTTLFKGNTASGESNAIYVEGSANTVTFSHKNGGKTFMYDAIYGASGYSVDITGDSTGTMYLFNDIKNANVSMGGIELNTINNKIHEYNFNALDLTNDINMAVDVDLVAESMDRLIVGDKINPDIVTGSGMINVVGMNLKNDMSNGQNTAHILFADNNLKDKVAETTLNLDSSHPYQTTAYAPIYKYTAIYNKTDDGGFFDFTRGGMNPQPSPDDFNPAVLSEPVAAQAQIMAINNIVTNYAFHNVDTNMNVAQSRLSSRYANRYAIAETDIIKDDLNTNNPLFIEPDKESVWVKPFVTFENIPLRNGPNVKSINYGTLIGYDSQVFHHKRGWDGVWTGYVGYNGSNMHYSGVDSTSNGGLLGATYSLYKGNFFNATTLTTGAMNTQARTMYGNDNMTSLYAGVGNKTGYNFNFKEGLFTIQPSFLISYTFGKTFDFTNAAGVRINSDPIHAIQLSPGIKFFMNTKNGWQPYIGVNMMWNIMDQTHTRANGVRLPEMSVKPYVQYGIGVQKVMKDHFTAYGQAMIQNGGRNGISLTGGFKWAIGRDHKKIEKVQRQDSVKTVIKTKRHCEECNDEAIQKTYKGQRHVLKG